MFNINLEEAELEFKGSKDTLDYTKDLNIFEALEGVQTTLAIMISKEASYNIMEGSLLLESKLLNIIMNEEEDSNEEDHDKRGRLKKTWEKIVNAVKKAFRALAIMFKLKERTLEESVAKYKKMIKPYFEKLKVKESRAKWNPVKDLIKYTDKCVLLSDNILTLANKEITKYNNIMIKMRFVEGADLKDLKKFNIFKTAISKAVEDVISATLSLLKSVINKSLINTTLKKEAFEDTGKTLEKLKKAANIYNNSKNSDGIELSGYDTDD